MRVAIFIIVMLNMISCIGTDFVDVPLGPSASQAVIEESEVSLIKGNSFALSYKVISTDGSEVAGEWAWSSRDGSIADVSQEGVVTAIEQGQTWIDGIANAILHDSVLVTVVSNADEVASVRIEGDTSNMVVGEMRQLTAVLLNFNGDVLAGDVSWSSNKPSIASIAENGVVSALANGSTEIIAKSGSVSSVPFNVLVGSEADIRSGTFSGRNGYNAMGMAVLETNGTLSTLSFSSDFSAQSGPGLHAYLSPNENNVSGGLDLGALISTSGAQSYEVPGSADPDQYNYVIIYCQPFGVLFAGAPLQ